MTRNKFKKYVEYTLRNVKGYTDKEGETVTAQVKRLLGRKCIDVIFWHGCSDEIRNEFLSGRIRHFDMCGYPVVFNNHKGGGMVESYTIMWTDKIYY